MIYAAKPIYYLPLLGYLVTSVTAFATVGQGECYPINNTPYQYETTFIKNVTNPDDNQGGVKLDNFYKWDLGKNYQGYCKPSTPAAGYTYFRATSNLAYGDIIDGKQFFKINEYLSAAARIYIWGKGYVSSPFNDVVNSLYETISPDVITNNWNSGAEGWLDIYITKPFVTSLTIPKTKIVALYATRTPGNYANVPMSEVAISGSITVPQGCEINAGQVISIDFGTINSRNFSTKGEKPDAVAPVEKNITFRCFGLTDTAKLSLRVMGRTDADLPSAIASDKPGIGVMVANAQGNVLTPNSTKEPLSLNLPDPANNRNAEVKLQAWPVNTNGLPAPKGVFTATGTLQVDFD
ncbi:long polar fimbrial protein LpfD [Serratia quinivorans]|uniref:fimbrial protein n=1 Tax=Serratia quinivorans TaxID=137545 RepID=UPI001C49060C|nr:fimbrial protein [Serratia quinivorans]MBV6694200.1 fimbrial protein [Serratia quinivorans]CAI1895778.1 long polar fimbrial protein LpfD [Serratia quinivorans]